jgi:thiamine transport system substrate-binding protein
VILPSHRPARRAHRRRAFATVLVGLTILTACGQDGPNDGDGDGAFGGNGVTTVRVVTHDSFAVTESLLTDFERDTGIRIELVAGGDAVEVVNKAILTKGNPEGDVLFGVDNNLLDRALDEGIFDAYESPALADVAATYQLDAEHRVTPIDVGDVCLNYDRAYFRETGLAVPTSLEQLSEPSYRNLLAVQNPSTSTPGLAFLLATRAQFGEEWLDFWDDLKANGVLVTDGWEQAYYDAFSGGSGQGDRPLVVSYASSPPVEVVDPSISPDEAPTGVIPASCYRQIEFAGILAGTANREAAERVIDFLLSTAFQEDMPLQMFVYPVNARAALPEAFTKFSVVVDEPLSLPPDEVAANRDAWVEEWTELFGS